MSEIEAEKLQFKVAEILGGDQVIQFCLFTLQKETLSK